MLERRLFKHTFADIPSESNFPVGLPIEFISLAIVLKCWEEIGGLTMKDDIDSIFAGNILDLSAAEIEGGRQDVRISLREFGYHLHPYLFADGSIGVLELDLDREKSPCRFP